MANSLTVIFMINFMIALLLVFLGGPSFQLVETEFLNSYLLIGPNNELQYSNDTRFLQQGEDATTEQTGILGFIDVFKLIADFLTNVLVNTITLPLTIMLKSSMPLAFQVVYAVPMGMLNIMAFVSYFRGFSN